MSPSPVAARPQVALPEPAPAVASTTPLHDITPTGRPSWYGQRVGREERSFLSFTGDVELIAGNTFGTPFPNAAAALVHAAEVSSKTDNGAVLVFRTASDNAQEGSWHLARSYNVEQAKGMNLAIGHSSFDGKEKLTNWHPEVAFVVSGPNVITPKH